MNTNWLKARQTKYTAYVTLYIVIILAVLGIVNFLANRHNKSYDSTSGKRFSLSDQTIKVVQGLEADVKISYYAQTSRFLEARDLLDRYSNLSSKLSIDYIDPDKKPQIARAAGVRSYGTIYVDAGGKREEAKSLTEEEVTNALIRALKGGVRTVCAVQGSGEHGLNDTERDGYSSLNEIVENSNYTTETISLLENPEVPGHCTILMVGGPRFDYIAPSVDAIKNYVETGGRALIMLDPPVQLGSENIGENREMVKLLDGWGVTVNNDLVLDTSGIGSLFGLSEVVPLVSSYEPHAIVRDMREVATAFPLSRTLETKAVDEVTVDALFSTTSNSYATTNLSSAEIEIDPSKDKQGPLTLAAAGAMAIDESTSEDADQQEGEAAGSEIETTVGGEGRFVVVGSSGWAANNILHFNGNRDLVLNMLNWLSSDEDLISIRPKEPEDRRLSLSQQQMSTIFYLNVIGLPVVIIAVGLGVWWRRR